MRYQIKHTGWTKDPATGAPGHNYNHLSFFKGEPSSFFSRDDAERWIEENFFGPDDYGVGPLWEVVEQHCSIKIESVDIVQGGLGQQAQVIFSRNGATFRVHTSNENMFFRGKVPATSSSVLGGHYWNVTSIEGPEDEQAREEFLKFFTLPSKSSWRFLADSLPIPAKA